MYRLRDSKAIQALALYGFFVGVTIVGLYSWSVNRYQSAVSHCQNVNISNVNLCTFIKLPFIFWWMKFIQKFLVSYRWSCGSRFFAYHLRDFNRCVERLHCHNGVVICIAMIKWNDYMQRQHLNIFVLFYHDSPIEYYTPFMVTLMFVEVEFSGQVRGGHLFGGYCKPRHIVGH